MQESVFAVQSPSSGFLLNLPFKYQLGPCKSHMCYFCKQRGTTVHNNGFSEDLL